MAYVLEQYYDTGNDSHTTWGWQGQTFTTVSGFTLTRAGLFLYRDAASSGNITYRIRATSAGLPTGEDLASGSFPAADVTQNTSGEWYYVDFSPGVELEAETQYALFLTHATGGSVYYAVDVSSPQYSGGTWVGSPNNGASWSSYASIDGMFRTYSGSEIVTEDVSATIVGVGSITGTVRVLTTEEVSATIAGVSTITATASGSQTSTTVKDSDLKILTRLIAINNDCLYYEDV